MDLKNIYSETPDIMPEELFEDILINKHFRLERIVSRGHATPEGQWYDQAADEWVILLQGEAGLSFEGDERIRQMTAGDYIYIPAHVRHRVAWTKENEKTVWLALHFVTQKDEENV